MRKIEKFSLFASACTLPMMLGAQTVENTQKPNVLFIMVDDYGWADTGYNGSRFYETPNLDRLASESMQFTDGYAAAPQGSPSR